MHDEAVAEAVLHLSWRPDGGLRIWSPTHPGMVLSHARPDLVMLDVLPVLAELGFPQPNAGGSAGFSDVSAGSGVSGRLGHERYPPAHEGTVI